MYDVSFKLEIEAMVPVQARSESEAVNILNNKMIRVIEVSGRKVQEIDVDTKITLVTEDEYD